MLDIIKHVLYNLIVNSCGLLQCLERSVLISAIFARIIVPESIINST